MSFPRTVPVNVTTRLPWPGMSTAILKVTLFPLTVPSVIWTVPACAHFAAPFSMAHEGLLYFEVAPGTI
jgi:hypothetical protein